MKIEIKITGDAQGPVDAMVRSILESAANCGLVDGRANYSYGRIESGLMFGPEIEAQDSEDDAVEMAVNFASIVSARLADEHNLNASDFDDMTPSGKRGFTVDDVMALVGNAGAV